MTEDEMVGWHHRLDGYEFEQAVVTNLDSILKSGDIILPTNVHLVKAMV